MKLFQRHISLEEANNELDTNAKYRKFLIELHNRIVDLQDLAHDAKDGRVSKSNQSKAKAISESSPKKEDK